jgi:hypothetical protein
MRTRRGWQATMGELDTVLSHRDVAQEAEAQAQGSPRVTTAGW